MATYIIGSMIFISTQILCGYLSKNFLIDNFNLIIFLLYFYYIFIIFLLYFYYILLARLNILFLIIK